MEIGILASGILSALAFWTVAYCPLLLCSLAFQHWRFVWLHFRHWYFGLWCFGYWHFSCVVLSGYHIYWYGYHQSNAATTNGNLSEDIAINDLSSNVPNIAKLMKPKVCTYQISSSYSPYCLNTINELSYLIIKY